MTARGREAWQPALGPFITGLQRKALPLNLRHQPIFLRVVLRKVVVGVRVWKPEFLFAEASVSEHGLESRKGAVSENHVVLVVHKHAIVGRRADPNVMASVPFK